jgi:hypothetical protein
MFSVRVKGTRIKAAGSPHHEPNFYLMPAVASAPTASSGSKCKVKDSTLCVMDENDIVPIHVDDDFPMWPLDVDDELDNLSVDWLPEHDCMDQDSDELPSADRHGDFCEKEEDGTSFIATIEHDWFVRLALDLFMNC